MGSNVDLLQTFLEYIFVYILKNKFNIDFEIIIFGELSL